MTNQVDYDKITTESIRSELTVLKESADDSYQDVSQGEVRSESRQGTGSGYP